MSNAFRDSRGMRVTQVWFTTPVDYLKVPDNLKGSLVDELLKVEGVNEVEHYSEFNVRCGLQSECDAEAVCEIQAIRSRIEQVFRSYHVWPEDQPQG